LEIVLTIAISAPAQLSSTQNTTPVRINAGAGQVSTIQPQVTQSSSSSKITITPAPVVQVNSSPQADAPALESPYIKITQQSAETNNLNKQDLTQAAPVDQRPKQIQALDQEQQNINIRKTELTEQEQAIEREITQLQQKEIEVNRKKFQLQQATGNLLNLQA
jgi:hypothetical protein